MSIDVKYRTSATANGGRDGPTRSEDGQLDLHLSTPNELGGPGGEGITPTSCSRRDTPHASWAR
ncbi:hypothetical protein PMI02_01674 [Novosphingobium sp. AP12]|nr:hypothetical protein PMI02_01674 [Novosphingobium sp. AP12]